MILLVTDWLPLVTHFFSCTYARNGREVTSGNHVKICVWLPTNPITTGLAGAVTTVTTVTSVFLYIYGFFFGERADDGRADFELTPCSQTLMTTPPACPRIMGATKPLPKILTCANWGYIWGYVGV